MTAFLGYVLPYGQMSHWGATVITNLLSAIPWIGKSLVESTILIIIKIMVLSYLIYNIFIYIVLFNKISSGKDLESIGKISPYAVKKGKKGLIDKSKFLDIPYSFLAMLVGFIDGDAYICIAKTRKKYIKLCLVISLDIKDLSILEYIHSRLKIGKIKTYPKLGNKKTCKLVIHKTELQDILFPLFLYYNIFF